MNTFLWVKFQINVSNRLFIVSWKAEKMILPRKVNSDHISVTDREGHLWLPSHTPYPQTPDPFKCALKSMGEKSRSSQNLVIFSAWEHSRTTALRLPCISVEHGAELWLMVCEQKRRLPRGARPTSHATCKACPHCTGRKGAEHPWGSGNLGDDRTTRLNSSVSLNHSIGRPPLKCPTPYNLSRGYTFCKLSHWSFGVVSYSTQPHRDTGNKSESHSMMTADRQLHKSIPAVRTFTNENRICWQSEVQILKDRSWVQNSGGSAGEASALCTCPPAPEDQHSLRRQETSGAILFPTPATLITTSRKWEKTSTGVFLAQPNF